MSQPNILLLIFDDMSVDQIERMPNVMKLAKTGVNFLNAFANTAICQPARVTIGTGQYSHNHGITGNTVLTNTLDQTTMLASRLQAAGYQTSFIGKYFNTWDNTVIPPGWTDWHHTSSVGYYNYPTNDNGVVSSRGTARTDYQTTVCSTFAQSFIASATQPFFMQVGFKAPHFDTPTTDYLNATPDASYTGVVPTSKLSARNPNFNVLTSSLPGYMQHAAMDSSKINEIDAFWRGSTEELFSADQAVGAIVAALIAAGKTNTVIIIVSDNGYFRGEDRNPSQKVAPYLAALRVPLIIAGLSSFVAQGHTCSQLVSHIDLTATIFELSGATPSVTRPLDGLSMTSIMLNPETTTSFRSYLLSEFLGTDGSGFTGWNATIPVCSTLISSSYLYTSYLTGEVELYSTLTDPYQLTNLAGLKAYQSVQTDMDTKLNSIKNCSGTSCNIK